MRWKKHFITRADVIVWQKRFVTTQSYAMAWLKIKFQIKMGQH